MLFTWSSVSYSCVIQFPNRCLRSKERRDVLSSRKSMILAEQNELARWDSLVASSYNKMNSGKGLSIYFSPFIYWRTIKIKGKSWGIAIISLREQGESARLPPMCHGFDSQTRCHTWVEFVVGSLVGFQRFFSEYSGFPLSSKNQISKFWL